MSSIAIATYLNARRIAAPNGGQWFPIQFVASAIVSAYDQGRGFICWARSGLPAAGVAEGTKVRSQAKAEAREALERVEAGEALREIALSYNVDHTTIHRLKARYAAEV